MLLKIVKDEAYPVYFPTSGKYYDFEIELSDETLEWVTDGIQNYQEIQEFLAEKYLEKELGNDAA